MGALARILDVAPPRGQASRMARDVEEMAERLAAEEHTRARFIGKVNVMNCWTRSRSSVAMHTRCSGRSPTPTSSPSWT